MRKVAGIEALRDAMEAGMYGPTDRAVTCAGWSVWHGKMRVGGHFREVAEFLEAEVRPARLVLQCDQSTALPGRSSRSRVQ